MQDFAKNFQKVLTNYGVGDMISKGLAEANLIFKPSVSVA